MFQAFPATLSDRPMSRNSAESLHSPAAIWERVLLPDNEELSPEQARYFLRLKFPARDLRRMNALATKARGGTLTDTEDEELESFIHVGHLLGILQSRARQVLNSADRLS
jgi:hypothetical protein